MVRSNGVLALKIKNLLATPANTVSSAAAGSTAAVVPHHVPMPLLMPLAMFSFPYSTAETFEKLFVCSPVFYLR